MKNFSLRLAAVLSAVALMGTGCTSAPGTPVASGAIASVDKETQQGGQVLVTLSTRGNAVPSDLYDATKLPMSAAQFYGDNPVAGLNSPTSIYQDEDGDTNRLYVVKGGALATIETDGDPLSIVEFRPDDLKAADFLSADVMAHVPLTGDVLLNVLNDGDKNDILFLVTIKDGKVVSVSP